MSAENQAPVAASAPCSRRHAVIANIGKQHVLAVPGGAGPQGNHAAFASAVFGSVFGARASPTVLRIEIRMVDRVSCRHASRVALGHGLKGGATVQGGKPVRVPKRIKCFSQHRRAAHRECGE